MPASSVQYALKSFRISSNEYKDEIRSYNQAIKGKTFTVGSEEYEAMKAWEARIIAAEHEIDALEAELGHYYYLPSSEVSNYNIYW